MIYSEHLTDVSLHRVVYIRSLSFGERMGRLKRRISVRLYICSINSHINLGHGCILLEFVFNLKPKLNSIQ
jgi:hypothetical protein